MSQKCLTFDDRPFRHKEKGTEETAAHSDSLGNSRKLGKFPVLR